MPADSNTASSDTSDDEQGTTVHQLAYIQEFSTDAGGGNLRLPRRTGAGGPSRVVIDAIVELASIMRSNGSEQPTTRFASLLFDSNSLLVEINKMIGVCCRAVLNKPFALIHSV